MRVLGIWFDREMRWQTQLRVVREKGKRLPAQLMFLRRRFSDEQISQVITSNYFSVLYYGSEVWYDSLSFKDKNPISPIHHFPLRLIVRDFKHRFSRKQLSFLTKRLRPRISMIIKLQNALCQLSISVSLSIFFMKLMSNSAIEMRAPLRPRLFDSSRTKIGHQSFANPVGRVARKLQFHWLDGNLTKDATRNPLLLKCNRLLLSRYVNY